MMSELLSLPVQIQAALIGAAAALVVVLLRDLLGPLFLDALRERRERRKAALAVYGAYADPLAATTEYLFWRLREIFYEPSRAVFLKLPEPNTEYQRYKKSSTVYRMVALLGWIRAFRRELSFFTVDDRTRLHNLEDAIAELESALADGQGVEILRVEGLAKLWGLKLPEDARRKSAASVGMEAEITTRFDLGELSEIREQTETRKQEICTLAAEVLCKELGQEAIEQELIDKTCPQAAELLAVHEAWLYRDWQAAIGDLMLREIASEKRRFEVKGYADFCGMAKQDAPERGWIDLLERILHKVDVSRRDGADARVQQLERTLVASARILTALSEVKQRPESVSNDTLRAARKVLSNLSAPRWATSSIHSVESTDKKWGK